MNNFNDEIDYFVDKLENENISNLKKLKYLKLYSKLLNEQREKIDNDFILGTFISGVGVGNIFTSPYFSAGMITIGIAISIIGYAANYPDITLDDIKIKSKKKP